MNKIIPSPMRLIIGFLSGLLMALTVMPGFAADAPPQIAWVEGAKIISMGDKLATLSLPAGYLFADAEDTGKLMKHLGNPVSNLDIGLVVPDNDSKDWFIVYQYNPMGYVSDSDSNSIDKDALLTSIKAKTEEDNKQRQAQGVDQIIDISWQEEPRYDPVSHNLTWAISATEGGKSLVNYNTRKLGRSGVTSINLVATPTTLPTLKPAMDVLVAGYDYVPGKKYSDFIAGTDKTAEIGLIALIAGGSAAKTGAFAKIFLFLAAILKKGWVFIAIGVGVISKKLSGGKQSASTTTVESDTDPKED